MMMSNGKFEESSLFFWGSCIVINLIFLMNGLCFASYEEDIDGL